VNQATVVLATPLVSATFICVRVVISCAYVGMVYWRISVSPGTIDTMTRTGRSLAV